MLRTWMACPAAALAATAAAWAGERVAVEWKPMPGAKLSYSVAMDVDVKTTVRRGDEADEGTSCTKTGLVMALVPGEPGAEGRRPCKVTLSSLDVNQAVEGPDGKFTVGISGGELKLTRDGKVAVDTKAGVRKDLADAVLREFAFADKEGAVVVDASGRVADPSGPNEFVASLTGRTGEGLFPLEFPSGEYGVGESWESAGRRIERLRALDLSQSPVDVPVRYVLDAFEEREGRRLARVTFVSDVSREGLTARAAASGGAGESVRIARFARKATGRALFDCAKGEFVEGEVKTSLEATLELEVKGAPVEMTWKGDSTVTMKLLAATPTAPATPAAPAAPVEAPK
jgi:hypothetical protein